LVLAGGSSSLSASTSWQQHSKAAARGSGTGGCCREWRCGLCLSGYFLFFTCCS
jgi:hypothetical protein